MSSSNFYKVIDHVHVGLVIMGDWEILPVDLGIREASKMIFEFVKMEPEVGIEDIVVMKEGWFGVGQKGG